MSSRPSFWPQLKENEKLLAEAMRKFNQSTCNSKFSRSKCKSTFIMKRLIYVVDLDDTLCKTEMGVGPDGKRGPQYFDSTPISDRINKINELHDGGHIIIIETARVIIQMNLGFLKTLNQLKDWGLNLIT